MRRVERLLTGSVLRPPRARSCSGAQYGLGARHARPADGRRRAQAIRSSRSGCRTSAHGQHRQVHVAAAADHPIASVDVLAMPGWTSTVQTRHLANPDHDRRRLASARWRPVITWTRRQDRRPGSTASSRSWPRASRPTPTSSSSRPSRATTTARRSSWIETQPNAEHPAPTVEPDRRGPRERRRRPPPSRGLVLHEGHRGEGDRVERLVEGARHRGARVGGIGLIVAIVAVVLARKRPAGAETEPRVSTPASLPPRRPAVFVALAALLWVACRLDGVASAHAVLEASTPADGSVVPTSPAKVTLQFSEHVTLTIGSLRVFDRNGHRVDQGTRRTAPRTRSSRSGCARTSLRAPTPWPGRSSRPTPTRCTAASSSR